LKRVGKKILKEKEKRIVSPGALLPSHLIKMYNTGDDEWDRKRK